MKLTQGRIALPLLGVAFIFASAVSTDVQASDRSLSRSTLLFISTDDIQGYLKSMKNSDLGAFLNDPEIKRITERLKAGFSTMFQKVMAEASGSEAEALKGMTDLVKEYLSTICEKADGRVMFSVGLAESESGALQPDLVFHCQGGEEIGKMHQRFREFFAEKMTDAPVAAVEMQLAGASFRGFDYKEEVPPAPVMPPDGLYFGEKGNNFYVGLTKRGLTDYIAASGSKTAANRLGDDPDYTRAVAAAGTGQLNSYINLPYVWRLVDRFLPMAGPEAAKIVDALGIRGVGSIYSTGSLTAAGGRSSAYIGIGARQGLLQIVPSTNISMALPAFVPRNVMSASIARLELSKALDIVHGIATKIGEEGAKQQVEKVLGEFESHMGIKLADLISTLEGSLVSFYLPSQGASGGMGLGVGMNMGKFILGLKLKDTSAFSRFLEGLIGHEQMGSMVTTEEFLKRKIYVVNPMGEGAPPGQMPTPSLVIEKDWFLFGSEPEVTRAALRAADGGDEGRLASDAEFKKLLSGMSGEGIMLGYVDQAQYLGDTMETLRPVLGFLPMMIPDLNQNPDLLFLFNPQNLPSRDVFKRYFGKTSQVWKIVDGGIQINAWSPSVRKPATKPKEKKI